MVELDRFWEPPQYPSHGPSIAGFGGVAAPLIAGFSLAAIVTLVTSSNRPPLWNVAITGFAVAISTLLFCIQFSYVAVGYWLNPTDILGWSPESKHNFQALTTDLRRQRLWMSEFNRYQRIAGRLYQLGIIAFLAGMMAVLVPTRTDWEPWRAVSVVVVGIAFLAELGWASGGALGSFVYQRFGKWVGPWVARANVKTLVPPPCVDPAIVEAMADDAERDKMRREAEHALVCSWTTLDHVGVEDGRATSLRGVPLLDPVCSSTMNGEYIALFGTNDKVVAVLPDRVAYGCRNHVRQLLERWYSDESARPEAIEAIFARIDG